ncbi:isochorismatase family protein [Azoarcus sp. PA01]|nr:isochorismatase family protein [Azoarcus sp. PA01]
MLMNPATSALLVIDVQERLAPAIHDGEHVIRNCAWLAGVAARVGVPVVVTEHFPAKIGATLPAVAAAASGAEFVIKECFSAQADGCLGRTAVDARRQVIVCGTEAHVCVQQTALELRWAGKQVFVVADACGSRNPADRDLAFARMRAHGLEIVSREMVAFEWLQRGGTALFREINRDFIR